MRSKLTGLPPLPPTRTAAAKAPPSAADSPASPAPTPPAVPVATPPAVAATAPPVIDLAKLSLAQLPAQVTLKVTTEVADASGLKMKIDPGNRLKLVRLEGDQVIVSPGTSPFEGRVPVSGTDLMEQLAANPPPASPEPAPATPPAAVEPATPAAQPDPVPGAAPQAATTIPPAAEAPSQVPPATATVSAASGDAVEVMKAHIRSGAIKEFTFEQVLEWKVGADETLNGETYQTGLVRYKAGTIFGVKTIDAKALLQNGRLVRWVWPKNPSMEIK